MCKMLQLLAVFVLVACFQMAFSQETCTTIDAVTSPTGKFKITVASKYCGTSATLVWQDSYSDGTRMIEWGTSTSYGKTITLTGKSGSAVLSPLTPNTKYYWRVNRSYQGNNPTTPAGSFTTSGGTPIVQPPVITSAVSVSCTTGTTKIYTATATDPANKSITFTFSGQPSWITASGAVLTLKPVTGSQNCTVKIIATNGSAADTLDLAVTVVTATVVQPPVITSAPSVSCTTGTTKTYTATATDPANKTITFTFSGQPSWITVSGAVLTLKPIAGSQNCTVKIIATNGTAADTQNLAVTVISAVIVLPPAITSEASVTCTTNTTKSYTATATGGEPVTFTFKSLTFGSLPSWMSAANGTLILKPLTSSPSSTVKVIAGNSVGYDTLDLTVSVVQPSAVINHSFSRKGLSIRIGNTPVIIPFSDEKILTVSLFSLEGSLVNKRVVYVENAKKSNVTFSSQISGTYICKVTSKSDEITQKIVLQK